MSEINNMYYSSLIHIFLFYFFKLDPSIFESLQKERVEAGDVIYIEANSGAVKVRPRFVCHEETEVRRKLFSSWGPGCLGRGLESGAMLMRGQQLPLCV